jgi:AraC-like DNA-binding protein
MQIYTNFQKKLKQTQPPEERVQMYLNLIKYLLYRRPLEAQQYINEAEYFAEQHQFFEYKTLFLLYRVNICTILGETKNMLDAIWSVGFSLQKINNTAVYYYVVAVLQNLSANLFQRTPHNIEAIKGYFKSLELLSKQAEKNQKNNLEQALKIQIYQGISYAFLELGETENAIMYLELAACLVGLSKSADEQIELLHRRAVLDWKCNKTDASLRFAQEAIDYSNTQKFGFYLKNAQLYAIQGIVYLEQLKQYPEALQALQKAIQIAEFFKANLILTTLYQHLARVYEALKDWENACVFWQKSAAGFKAYAFDQSVDYIEWVQKTLSTTNDNWQNKVVLKAFFDKNNEPESYSLPEFDSAYFYKWLQQQCGQPTFTVEKIAQHFNMSSRTLNRRVQAIFGITTQKMITFVRLQKAYKLLAETSKSIAEIAEMVGFEHLSYFGMVFKKHFGILPSNLRLSEKL